MATEPDIVCPLSKWYYRRFALLLALASGLALYFLYDGAAGYPKKNRQADLYEAFQATVEGTDWQPAGEVSELPAEHLAEIEKARQAGRDGSSWVGFAAERHMAEKAPDRYTEEDIRQQFHIAAGLGIFALFGLLLLFLRRKRALRCDSESLTLPNGSVVPITSITAVDIRKWDRGYGQMTYCDEKGSERRTRIDDYKFAGSDAVLRRVCEVNDAVVVEGDRRWLWPEVS